MNSPPKPDDAGPARKRYITRAGYDRFQEELKQLWNVERRRVVLEVQTAAAHGDRSENAEYIYGKRRLREIDKRVQYLTKLLDDATVVEASEKKKDGRVYFGSRVTIEDEEGVQSTYQLVGPDEFDVKAGRISIDSPLGRALLGKKVDDAVTVRRPKGDAEMTLVAVL